MHVNLIRPSIAFRHVSFTQHVVRAHSSGLSHSPTIVLVRSLHRQSSTLKTFGPPRPSNPWFQMQRRTNGTAGARKENGKVDDGMSSNSRHDHDHEHKDDGHDHEGHSHSHGGIFHSHSHDHGDQSAEAVVKFLKGEGTDRGTKVTVLGLLTNVGLTAVKGAAGWYVVIPLSFAN